MKIVNSLCRVTYRSQLLVSLTGVPAKQSVEIPQRILLPWPAPYPKPRQTNGRPS
jgi:hypothetical protein